MHLFKTIFIIILFFSSFVVFSQTKEDLENKINLKNSDIEKLEAEIKSHQTELNSLSKQKNTLANLIKELDLTRKKLILNITLTENKIEKTNLKIESLGNQILDKESLITINKKAVNSTIRNINELEQTNLISMLASTLDLSNLWNSLEESYKVRDSIKAKTLELNKIKGELEDSQNVTEKAKLELIALRKELDDEKKLIEQNKKDKESILSKTKNNEALFQKLLKDKKAKKDALEKELRDYESQLKFILDPNTLPSGRVLSWPLENVFVTQLFGKTSASKRLYTSGSHSGVDFRASVGTPVLAMADGVVGGVGDTDVTCPGASFGKWIFIEHSNGLSTAYGHLSLHSVVGGQKVSRGQIIGYSGNTGHTTGPHLHISVYAKAGAKVQTLPSKSCPGKTLTQPIAPINGYLDPMTYLPAYNN